MSGQELYIDKLTVANVMAAVIIIAYLGFLFVYPNIQTPEMLKNIVNIVIGYLFTSAGFTVGWKVRGIVA